MAQHGAHRSAKVNLVNACDSVFQDGHAAKFTLFEVYGVLVESCATIDETGVHPERLAPLPAGSAAVCASHLTELELTVEAAIEGDGRKAPRALCMDPAIQVWSVTAPLLDEMLQATMAYFPQFH